MRPRRAIGPGRRFALAGALAQLPHDRVGAAFQLRRDLGGRDQLILGRPFRVGNSERIRHEAIGLPSGDEEFFGENDWRRPDRFRHGGPLANKANKRSESSSGNMRQFPRIANIVASACNIHVAKRQARLALLKNQRGRQKAVFKVFKRVEIGLGETCNLTI